MEGFKDFQKNIDKLIKEFSSNRAAGVVLEAAKVGRNAARSKAPRGKSGNLKKGIVAKKFKKQSANPTAYIAIDYKKAPHAHLIEFGHALVLGDWFPGVNAIPAPYKTKKKGVNRRGKKFKKIKHVAAKPFFRKSISSAQNAMFNKMVSEASDLLKKVRT